MDRLEAGGISGQELGQDRDRLTEVDRGDRSNRSDRDYRRFVDHCRIEHALAFYDRGAVAGPFHGRRGRAAGIGDNASASCDADVGGRDDCLVETLEAFVTLGRNTSRCRDGLRSCSLRLAPTSVLPLHWTRRVMGRLLGDVADGIAGRFPGSGANGVLRGLSSELATHATVHSALEYEFIRGHR